jgi:hypothetical protein
MASVFCLIIQTFTKFFFKIPIICVIYEIHKRGKNSLANFRANPRQTAKKAIKYKLFLIIKAFHTNILQIPGATP